MVFAKAWTKPPVSRIYDRQSEVWLNGLRLDATTRVDLPLGYRPEGERSRIFRRQGPKLFGAGRLVSFSGDLDAREAPFTIIGPVDDPRYDLDYLLGAVNATTVPEALRPLVGPISRTPEVKLTACAFELQAPEGSEKLIPLPST